jgi:catechol 2,3-dioxygenase-like lactoylglutathione lyase family enzyme
VADVERSKEFYLRIPGTALIYQRPGEFALIQMGRGRLQLLPAEQPQHGPRPFHLEATAPDVDALYEALLLAGVPTDGPPADRPWGDRSFHAVDPDGNEIEFARPWEAQPPRA